MCAKGRYLCSSPICRLFRINSPGSRGQEAAPSAEHLHGRTQAGDAPPLVLRIIYVVMYITAMPRMTVIVDRRYLVACMHACTITHLEGQSNWLCGTPLRLQSLPALVKSVKDVQMHLISQRRVEDAPMFLSSAHKFFRLQAVTWTQAQVEGDSVIEGPAVCISPLPLPRCREDDC